MKILALEFSSMHRSVAVADCDGVRALIRGTAREVGARETKAFSMIQTALSEAQLDREQIECLALGLGPGSYAGIRVAISVAQGWQLVRDVKLLGVSSVESLAHQARDLGISGKVNIAVDAQRNEFYLSTYAINDKILELIEPLHLAAASEVREQVLKGEKLIGPELHDIFAEAEDIYPDARSLAHLAANRTDFVKGEHLEPIYLRAPNFVKAPPPRVLPP
jgi:tRNA threonylcarbamoyl adenosine modification protein YeaZ